MSDIFGGLYVFIERILSTLLTRYMSDFIPSEPVLVERTEVDKSKRNVLMEVDEFKEGGHQVSSCQTSWLLLRTT